jgi:phosphohistidine swiveling domain-containing protein
MQRCPPGYVRRGDRCIRRADTPNNKRKAAAKKKKEASSNVEQIRTTSLTNTDPYSEFYKIGNAIYNAWQSRPDIPAWLSYAKGSPAAVGIEAAESFVDLQLEVAKDISQGKVAGKDQYGAIERERVESIGTDFTWSPGGFQI